MWQCAMVYLRADVVRCTAQEDSVMALVPGGKREGEGGGGGPVDRGDVLLFCIPSMRQCDLYDRACCV